MRKLGPSTSTAAANPSQSRLTWPALYSSSAANFRNPRQFDFPRVSSALFFNDSSYSSPLFNELQACWREFDEQSIIEQISLEIQTTAGVLLLFPCPFESEIWRIVWEKERGRKSREEIGKKQKITRCQGKSEALDLSPRRPEFYLFWTARKDRIWPVKVLLWVF